MSGDNDVDELYQEVILDHFKHPRCRGCLKQCSSNFTLVNPLCGDQITLEIQLEEDKVKDIGFSGHGCSISQAAASMMTELCKGKTTTEVRKHLTDYKDMMRGTRSADDLVVLGDVVALQGVRKFSARVKCAMLAWEALEKCLDADTKLH